MTGTTLLKRVFTIKHREAKIEREPVYLQCPHQSNLDVLFCRSRRLEKELGETNSRLHSSIIALEKTNSRLDSLIIAFEKVNFKK